MHVTVMPVSCLAVELVQNVRQRLHQWVGNMQLEKVVYFLNMLTAMLTGNQFWDGNSTNSISITKHRYLNVLGLLELNKLETIDTTSEHWLKLLGYVEIELRGHRDGEDSMNRGNFWKSLISLQHMIRQ